MERADIIILPYTPEQINDTLIGLIAGNSEAQRFYRSLESAVIRDEGIWIDL